MEVELSCIRLVNPWLQTSKKSGTINMPSAVEIRHPTQSAHKGARLVEPRPSESKFKSYTTVKIMVILHQMVEVRRFRYMKKNKKVAFCPCAT